MSAVDYKAEALVAISDTADAMETENFADADIAVHVAQVHATLALVEQQKTANMIALLGKEGETDLPPVGSGFARSTVLRKIRERLELI